MRTDSGAGRVYVDRVHMNKGKVNDLFTFEPLLYRFCDTVGELCRTLLIYLYVDLDLYEIAKVMRFYIVEGKDAFN